MPCAALRLCPARGAACAKPLADDAPRCVRCWTRYCNSHCQLEHWARGHKKQCKKIARQGGSEAVNADARAKAAAGEAVAVFLPDVPADAVCAICCVGQHGDEETARAPEGLVRGCACRGAAGLAHVSCLARTAQMATDHWAQTNMGEGVSSWKRCGNCGQDFHLAIQVALGWACWKTYLGRTDRLDLKTWALERLGHALRASRRLDEALPVLQAHVAMMRRVMPGQEDVILNCDQEISNCYSVLQRHDEAIRILREIYARRAELHGRTHAKTFDSANFLVNASAKNIVGGNQGTTYRETKQFARDQFRLAGRTLGAEHETTLQLRYNYACLDFCDEATRDALNDSLYLMEEDLRLTKRVFGKEHMKFQERFMLLTSLQNKLAQLPSYDESDAA